MSKRSALVRYLASGKVRVALVAALLLVATMPYVAWPQFAGNQLTINSAASGSNPTIRAEGQDTNIGITLVPKGTGTVSFGASGFSGGAGTFTSITDTGALTATTGPVSLTNVAKTTFLDATDVCSSDNTNLVKTRQATGDWSLARTAAGAETYNIHCAVGAALQAAASKGYRLDSFFISQFISVVALSSATFQGVQTTTYANNAAQVVTAYGGVTTITMPTATQANNYLTAGTFSAAAFVNPSTNANLSIDFQVVLANTGVYRLSGIVLNYTEALY